MVQGAVFQQVYRTASHLLTEEWSHVLRYMEQEPPYISQNYISQNFENEV